MPDQNRGTADRPTPALHSNNFDLIRMFGALQVAFWHSVVHLGLEHRVPMGASWLINRFPGVPIFFVVSGFLITASLERSPSLSHFVRNRFLRIFPGLWVCFAVTLLLLASLGALTPGFVRTSFVPWVVAQLTVAQFYNPAALRHIGVGVINGSLWTIPVELGFYATLPVLWLRRGRRDFAPLLLGLAIVSYLLWIRITSTAPATMSTKLLAVSPLPHLWLFFCGVLAQLHKDTVMPLVQGRALLWIAAYLALSVLVVPLRPAVSGLAYVVLALAVLSVAYTRPHLSPRLLHGEDASYGLYIYHMLVVNLAVETGLRGGWGTAVAVLAVSIVLGALSWRYVERPALKLKGRRMAPAASGAVVRADAQDSREWP